MKMAVINTPIIQTGAEENSLTQTSIPWQCAACVVVARDIVQTPITTQTTISQVTEMVITATITLIIQAGVMVATMTMTSMPKKCVVSVVEEIVDDEGGKL